jgi:hypothetical protein
VVEVLGLVATLETLVAMGVTLYWEPSLHMEVGVAAEGIILLGTLEAAGAAAVLA